MKIYKVTDPEFRVYGKIVDGYDVQPIVDALLASTPLSDGVEYVPEDPILQNLEASRNIAPTLYGGLPVEFGWCNGHNTRLNCLEYHRDSEFNLPAEDLILPPGQADRHRRHDARHCIRESLPRPQGRPRGNLRYHPSLRSLPRRSGKRLPT